MRLTAILITALLLISCDPLSDNGPSVAGNAIPGAEGVDCDHALRIDPTKHWNAFWFAPDLDDDAHHPVMTPLNRLGLLNMKSWTVHVPPNQPPPASPGPKGLHYPMAGLTYVCWRNEPEPTLLARGRKTNPDTHSPYWYGVALARPGKLYSISGKSVAMPESFPYWVAGTIARKPTRTTRPEDADTPGTVMRAGAHATKGKDTGKADDTSMSDEAVLHCRPSIPYQARQWTWAHQTENPEEASDPRITRGLHVEKSADDRVALVLDNGRRLAFHKSDAWIRSIRVGVDRYGWSPDGKWLVYTVGSMWGSLAGRNHTYMVPRSGEPKPIPLQGEVWAFTWVNNNVLLACVEPPGAGGRADLQYWRAPDLRRH